MSDLGASSPLHSPHLSVRTTPPARTVSASPHSGSGFHALYATSPAPSSARPPVLEDEIDASDLMPDSDDEGSEHSHGQEHEQEQHGAASPQRGDAPVHGSLSVQSLSPRSPSSVLAAAQAAVAAVSPKARSPRQQVVPAFTSLDDWLMNASQPREEQEAAGEATSSASADAPTHPAVPDTSSPRISAASAQSATATTSAHASASTSRVSSPTQPLSPAAKAAKSNDVSPAPPASSSVSPPSAGASETARTPPTPKEIASIAHSSSTPAATAISLSTASAPSAPPAAASSVPSATPPPLTHPLVFGSILPVDPAPNASCAEFDASFADVCASLTALQQVVRRQAAEARQEAEEEEQQFQKQRATLQERMQQTEDALAEIGRQRAQSTKQLEQLHAAVASLRADLTKLQSDHASLSATHTSVVASLTRRYTLHLLRAQPVHTLLRHSEGSAQGAHRGYLREMRKQARAAARAACHENVHQSGDDEEEEEEEESHAQAQAASPSAALSSPPPVAAAPSYPAFTSDDEDSAELLPAHFTLPFDASHRPIFPAKRYGVFHPRGPPGSVRWALPSSTLEHLFTYLGVLDLQACATVNKEWGMLLRGRTRVWKLLLKRVTGVEMRLKREKVRERERMSAMSRPPPAPRNTQENGTGSATPNGQINGHAISSVSADSPISSPVGTPLSRSGSMLTPATPGAGSFSASPHAPFGGADPPLTPATPGTGLLGSMLRRFRSGSVTNNPAAAAGVAATGVHAGSGGGGDAASLSLGSSSGDCLPTHLHYALTIELPSKDAYVLTVEGRAVRSSESDPRLCDSEVPPDERMAHSVKVHLCSLRRGQLQEELELCTQVFALQASLITARRECAQIRAQMDADEGRKKGMTGQIALLREEQSQVEHEVDRLQQQVASDALTRDFLAQQKERLEGELMAERQRTDAFKRQHEEKAQAGERERERKQAERQQQLAQFTELRAQKKQLSKEVKARQAELEREKAASAQVQAEYQQLVDQLAALKGSRA